MKKTVMMMAVAAVLLAGCGHKKTQNENTQNEASKSEETIVEEQTTEVMNIANCSMAFLEAGKLSFYDLTTETDTPCKAETDSVVNGFFSEDGKFYYNVAKDDHILLKCIDVMDPNPQPVLLTDWGIPFEKCVTETYGTVWPMDFYPERNKIALWYNFSWDGFGMSDFRVYDLKTGQLSDPDWETWQKEGESVEDAGEEVGESEVVAYYENLQTMDGEYCYGKGADFYSLTSTIDLEKYVSDPDYYHGPEFEPLRFSPDYSMLLFMIILEWGDYPHGILCISDLKGNVQIPLQDTDCAEFNAVWMKDNTLIYVGQDEETMNQNWNYATHCIKRVYPDGRIVKISDADDFCLR